MITGNHAPRALITADATGCPASLPERLAYGLSWGGVAGLMGAGTWTWVAFTDLHTLGWRYPAAVLGAGVVVGGVYGALFPRIYRIAGALALTSGAAALAVALVQILGSGHLGPHSLATAGMVAIAVLPLGVMARDMALYFAPHLQPLERRTNTFAWALLRALQRVPGFGQPLRRRRHARLLARDFPDTWLEVLVQRVPVYSRLPAEDRLELQRQITLFLAEKKIEGRGLLVSDAVRVTIAAQACLLTLRLGSTAVDCYSRLRTIVVYPHTFVPRRPGLDVGATPTVATLGESWRAGVVVLSWKSVRQGAADPDDGDNVVLHEFAHQLDQENGPADGLPILDPPIRFAEWVQVFHEHFERLQGEEARGEPTVLSYYGVTNPAEFFAVATEAFFERPRQLRHERRDLYEQLRLFYRQDPARYVSAHGAADEDEPGAGALPGGRHDD